MVSWWKAFKAAALTLLYGILWSLLGWVIVAIGLGIAIGSIGWGVSGLQLNIGMTYLGLAIAVGGFIVLGLGFLASLYKVGTELVADEVRARGVGSSRPTVTGPRCPNCGFENKATDRFCRRCGKQL
jgi:hypothetical protein